MAKAWAWSFSKKKNYDTCPKKHYEVDIQKNYAESTEQLKWGNEVHEALANACAGKAPLPHTMGPYQKWVDLVRRAPGELKVEEKYAISRDFQQAAYFGPTVWYRGVCDVLKLHGSVATALDWKTGKVQQGGSVQLMLMATCIFIHYPQIETVKTRFVWLQDDCTSPEVFHRQTIMNSWTSLIPEVNAMEAAAKNLDYPPKPSGLCVRYCPVTSCPFHGKGNRR